LSAANQAPVTLVTPTYSLLLTAGSWTTSVAETATQTVPDVTAPTVPTGLAASATTGTSTKLSWNASTDNVGVAGYNLYRVSGTTSTLIASPTASPYTVTGLLPLRSYTFAVTAFDAAGTESAKSTAISVTTTVTGWFTIRNDKSGLNLDVDGATTSTGTDLIQYPYHGGTNQQFRFQASGSGYKINPRHAEALAWSASETWSWLTWAYSYGMDLQSASSNDSSRIWQVVPIAGSDSYQFKSQAYTTMCASITGASTASLAIVELATCNASKPEQTFTLTEVAP
jgi:hypothetical protein